LRLRPTTRADADGLLAFFARLSGRSAYQRFHGARWIDRALVENLLDPDWRSRGVSSSARRRSSRLESW
jgi:hypothetical protein